MFCPPGVQGGFASRRRNRQQLRMRQVAMKEAIAAGWKLYDSDEESSGDEGDEHLGLDDTEKTSDVSQGMSEGPPDRGTSGCHYDSSFPRDVSLDDEDSASDSEGEDGTALANDNLHTLLESLIHQSLSPNTNSPYVFEDESKKFDMEKTAVSLCTGEIREETNPEVKKNYEPVAPVLSTNSIASSSDDDDDDGFPDTDSLDLGVPTSMWPSQKKDSFAMSTTNIAAKRAIADLIRVSDMCPEKDLVSPRISLLESDVFEAEEELATYSDEEPHEGSEVFLFTEGARYSDQQLTSAAASDFFKTEESPYLFSKSSMNSLDPIMDDNTDTVLRKELKVDVVDDVTQAQDFSNKKCCFGGIHLVSPTFFSSSERPVKPSVLHPAPIMSPLSSMVHPMNLSLFNSKDLEAPSRKKQNDVKSSKPVDRLTSSILKSEEHNFDLADSENRRSNLATSFRSSTKSNRLAYSLLSGKKSMSKSERVYSKSYLPNHPLLNPSSVSLSSSRCTSNRGSLAILLVDIVSKIFEVVLIDIQQDTSVGDVLAKARSSATDPALSEQKYVSFCYGTQEFGAPMLPVNLVIDWDKHKTRPLVVAVPVGSTASEMQSVKRVLWKNPKLRDWWKQEDPFLPKPKKEQGDAVVPMPSVKPVEPIVSVALDTPSAANYERLEV